MIPAMAAGLLAGASAVAPDLRLPWTAPGPHGARVADMKGRLFTAGAEVCACHLEPFGICHDFVARVLDASIVALLSRAGVRARFHRQHACAWCGPALDFHCRSDRYGWHKTSESTRRRSREDETTCKACGAPLTDKSGCFELVPVASTEAVA